MVFIDGIRTRADIERAVSEIRGLLSVNLMDAVTGVKTELIPIPELARWAWRGSAFRSPPSWWHIAP